MGVRRTPPGGRIAGLPADAVFRVAIPALATALGAASLVVSRSSRELGMMFAIAAGALSVGVVTAQAIESELNREVT